MNSYLVFWVVFYFCSDLPNFRHVSYKLIGKHFSVFFFFLLVFFSFSRYTICKKMLEKQKASFVSPSTKELQRKLLGNLMFFAAKKIQRNVFLSICSSHAKN